MLPQLSKHECYTIIVLFFINVINYMDRFTVASILGHLKDEFQIGDDYCGLLQTAFLISYTISAPLFGYLGDRYSRRLILICSVSFWTTSTVIGSFMRSYGWFFFLRTFVGIGEASFSTIAPTLIYDVTYKQIRKTALAFFYIAIPIGSGLGYVVGSNMARVGGHWSWGLRVTPVLAFIGISLLCFAKNPVRGERERLSSGGNFVDKTTKYKYNLRSLLKNRSYLLSTFGFASVSFVTGALAWWAMKFLHSGFRLIPGQEDLGTHQVALVCGIIAVVAGLIGVPLGALISYKLIRRYPNIDPIICAIVLIVGDPMIVIALIFSNKSMMITYGTIVVGQTLMNTTWPIVADILLSVVEPEARSTAEAFQITISHILGDAGSPYLVGLLSEQLKGRWLRNQPPGEKNLTLADHFEALRYALSAIVVMQLVAGMLFIACSFYIVADREKVIHELATSSTHMPSV